MRFPKKDRLDDPKYRAWVQKKPCLINNENCSHQETVAPHHIYGGHGRKDDKQIVPLCFNHHDNSGKESVHRLLKEKFEKLFNIDMLKIASKLYKEYTSQA